MWAEARRPLRRLAIRFVIGLGAIAIFCAAASHLLIAISQSKTPDIIPTAAIEESPSSIGVAKGADFYGLTEAEIDRTLNELQALGVQNIRVGVPWRAIEVLPDQY